MIDNQGCRANGRGTLDCMGHATPVPVNGHLPVVDLTPPSGRLCFHGSIDKGADSPLKRIHEPFSATSLEATTFTLVCRHSLCALGVRLLVFEDQRCAHQSGGHGAGICLGRRPRGERFTERDDPPWPRRDGVLSWPLVTVLSKSARRAEWI